MGTVIIGTSGYSYADWIGPVYPEGTPQKDFLKLYAREFRAVELNFSYYRQPEPQTTKKMADIAGRDFLFVVKGYKGLTHEREDDPHPAAEAFKAGVEPLQEKSQLAAVLLQFPHSFHRTDENREYLQTLCGEFKGLPLAVEFRSGEWRQEQVRKDMETRNLALVNVDEPDLPKLLKPSEDVTADFSYVRFHGRNKANWWEGDNASRYDYTYTDAELQEWVPRIRRMAEKSGKVLVFFNNHWKGQAAKNAKRMGELLAAGTK